MNYRKLRVYFDSGRYEDAIRLAGADPYSIKELSRLAENFMREEKFYYAECVLKHMEKVARTPEDRVEYYLSLAVYRLLNEENSTGLFYQAVALGNALASEEPEFVWYALNNLAGVLEPPYVFRLADHLLEVARALQLQRRPDLLVKTMVYVSEVVFGPVQSHANKKEKQKVRKRVFETLKEALNVAAQTGDEELINWCMLWTGVLYAREGTPGMAYKHLSKAVAYYLGEDLEVHLLREALYHLGFICYGWRNGPDGEENLKRSVEYLKEYEERTEEYLKEEGDEDTEELLRLAQARKLLADVLKMLGKEKEASLYRKKLRGCVEEKS